MTRLILGLIGICTLLNWVGCKPKYQIIKETETLIRDTVIYRPKVTIRDTIRATDTLIYNNWYSTVEYASDSSTKVELSYLKNKIGDLFIRCNAIPDTIEVEIEKTVTVTKPIYIENDKKVNWNNILIYIIIGLCLTTIVTYILNKLFR